MKDLRVDVSIFYGSLALLLIFVAPILVWPEASYTTFLNLKTQTENLFGSIYQLLAIVVLVYVLWLASSKHGKVVFGVNSYNFSDFSWASMLFCAGVATGILYWGIVEWAYYYLSPPFGLEPKSALATQYATIYGAFHWGPVGWAFYALPAVAIGYMYYVMKIPFLRISVACKPVLGRWADGYTGKLIDIFFMVGLLGSSGTSMGIGIPMIASILNAGWGIPDNFLIKIVIILFCAVVFSFSVYFGLGKGIKRLSNLNTSIAIAFLLFVLSAGPTVFILKMGLNNTGLMLGSFIKMLTWTDPLTDSRFVEDWTIFYWAWWVAVGPFMGIFIAKISGGRSIRQIILGTIVYGSLGSLFFFTILSNYALDLELSGVLDVEKLISSGNVSSIVPSVIQSLPIGRLGLAVFSIMSVIFIATSFDSTSYTLAACATRKMPADAEPAKWHRLFWSFVLIALPTALMFIGGLESLKLTVLLSALPLIIVYIILIIALQINLNTRNEVS